MRAARSAGALDCASPVCRRGQQVRMFRGLWRSPGRGGSRVIRRSEATRTSRDPHAPDPPQPTALISLSDASFDYGREKILRGVTVALHPGQKYALVGANGAGKTTLLSALAGELELPGGVRQLAGAVAIRLSAAGDDPGAGRRAARGRLQETVADAAFARERELERRLHEVAALLTREPAAAEQARLVHEQGRLQDEFERRDGYTMQRAAGDGAARRGPGARDLGSPRRTAQRRRAAAGGAGGGAAGARRPAAAGRAHQPSGPRSRASGWRGSWTRFAGRGGDRLARPALPGSRGPAHPAPGPRPGGQLQRQLHLLRRAEPPALRAGPGAVAAPADEDQTDRGVHPPQHRRPEDQAGPVAAQAAGQGGAAGAAHARTRAVPLPAGARRGRAAAPSWRRTAWARARAGVRCCATSTCTSRAATGSASSAPTAAASRRC